VDCIPCFLRQAVEAERMSSNDEVVREAVLREVMDYLLKEDWAKTPSELGTNIHRIVKKRTGKYDPYRRVKEEHNKASLKLYPSLKELVEESSNSLLKAIKVAIAGNVIDLGAGLSTDLNQAIQEVLESPFTVNHFNKLKNSIRVNRKVLFFADNAGEVFFDRVLLEELTKGDIEVTYVVKGGPIINDATLHDARAAEIENVARVTTTGTDCVGVLFEECSKEFLQEFEEAQLIISKGQGNYESMSNIEGKEIFFLLRAKCPVIAEDLGVKLGSIILKRSRKP